MLYILEANVLQSAACPQESSVDFSSEDVDSSGWLNVFLLSNVSFIVRCTRT